MPEITVVMRVHRGGRHFGEAVASLAAQTFPDWELLLVESGAAPAGEAEAVAARDPRVRRLCNIKGMGQAMAAGCEAARGRYIAVLDEDDIALPERLRLQRAYLELQPEVALLGSAVEIVGADGEPLGREPFVGLHEDIHAMTAYVHVLRHSSVMFRRTLLERVAYRPPVAAAEDYDFFCRAAEAARIACLPAILCRYRVHPATGDERALAPAALCGGLVRLLTRRRRSGLPEDLAEWTPRFMEAHAGKSLAASHLACARLLRGEGYDDLAALHSWRAWRAGGGAGAALSYLGSVARGIRRQPGSFRLLFQAWLKEPGHRLVRAGGMPDRVQF